MSSLLGSNREENKINIHLPMFLKKIYKNVDTGMLHEHVTYSENVRTKLVRTKQTDQNKEPKYKNKTQTNHTCTKVDPQ